jgi:hypothetical protein
MHCLTSFFATDTTFDGRTAVVGTFSPAQGHPVALLPRDSRKLRRGERESLALEIKASIRMAPHGSTISWSKHRQRPVCKDGPSDICKNLQRLICGE